MNDERMKKLQDPFPAEDIEWRVQRSGISANGNPWLQATPYITNRGVQQRLDDVFGIGGWENEQKPSQDGKGYLCTIRANIEGKWISKTDGAEYTNIEALKGALSGAMKRAAVQWGIGRYLYNLPEYFAVCKIVENRRAVTDNLAVHKDRDTGQKTLINWEDPILPEWALPAFDSDSYKEAISKAKTMIELKEAYREAYTFARSFNRDELLEAFEALKDERKARLDEVAQSNVETEFNAIMEWLEGQINGFKLIPEASAVKKVGETMRKHILKESEGQYYDKELVLNKLTTAVNDRVEELTATQNDKTQEN